MASGGGPKTTRARLAAWLRPASREHARRSFGVGTALTSINVSACQKRAQGPGGRWQELRWWLVAGVAGVWTTYVVGWLVDELLRPQTILLSFLLRCSMFFFWRCVESSETELGSMPETRARLVHPEKIADLPHWAVMGDVSLFRRAPACLNGCLPQRWPKQRCSAACVRKSPALWLALSACRGPPAHARALRQRLIVGRGCSPVSASPTPVSLHAYTVFFFSDGPARIRQGKASRQGLHAPVVAPLSSQPVSPRPRLSLP